MKSYHITHHISFTSKRNTEARMILFMSCEWPFLLCQSHLTHYNNGNLLLPSYFFCANSNNGGHEKHSSEICSFAWLWLVFVGERDHSTYYIICNPYLRMRWDEMRIKNQKLLGLWNSCVTCLVSTSKLHKIIIIRSTKVQELAILFGIQKCSNFTILLFIAKMTKQINFLYQV